MEKNLASEKKELSELIDQAKESAESAEKKPDPALMSKKERRKYERQAEREKIAELSFWRKIQYFLNYYSLRVLGIILACVALVFLVRQIYLITRPVALDLALVNDSENTQIEEVVESLYRAHYDVKDDAVFIIDSNYTIDPKAEYVSDMTYYTKMMSSITSNSTEIIICDADVVDYYAIDGYLLKLAYNLPEDQISALKNDDRFYTTKGLSGENEHTDDFYAIDLTGTKFAKEAAIGLEHPYLCVPCTLDEEHLQIAVNFIQMVLDLENE